MITLDEAKQYLGIDIVDAYVEGNVSRAIRFADAYLQAAVGKDYDDTDPKAKELALMLVDDVYNNRGITSGPSNNYRRLFNDLCEQLRRDLQGGDNG